MPSRTDLILLHVCVPATTTLVQAAAKEAKAAERARLAAEKKAAKEGEKLARKAEKEVARWVSGCLAHHHDCLSLKHAFGLDVA